ncbi:MAG: hypothetical protein K6F39_09385 [Lachnospiraceae bacterium]|nr:hypothetical protein [Lachnospiraceae bacterium]
MNREFHYFATYYAAMLAGFDEEESKKIAWAAEMVDELDSDLADDELKYDDNFVVTTQNSSWEMATENPQISDDLNSRTSHGIRGIWAPFHFLPGHLEDGCYEREVVNKKRYKNELINIEDHDPAYMDICLKLRCTPYSLTVDEMIRYIKGVYDSDADDDERLYALGLCMHVFADTWAHDDFSGVPCYAVNTVKYVNVKNEDLDFNVKREYTISSLTNLGPAFSDVNSAIYTGHGQINHAPDYDFLLYGYYPRYKCPRKSAAALASGDMTIINNPERFREAFLGMCKALSFFRGELENYRGGNGRFDAEADMVKKCIFIKTPKKDEADHEKIVIFKEDIWRAFLINRKCPTTDFKITDGDISLFAKQARAYRNHILEYLNNELKTLYPDPPIITFDIDEIDKWIKSL